MHFFLSEITGDTPRLCAIEIKTADFLFLLYLPGSLPDSRHYKSVDENVNDKRGQQTDVWKDLFCVPPFLW